MAKVRSRAYVRASACVRVCVSVLGVYICTRAGVYGICVCVCVCVEGGGELCLFLRVGSVKERFACTLSGVTVHLTEGPD